MLKKKTVLEGGTYFSLNAHCRIKCFIEFSENFVQSMCPIFSLYLTDACPPPQYTTILKHIHYCTIQFTVCFMS